MNPNTTQQTNGALLPTNIEIEDRKVTKEELKSVYVSLSFSCFGNSAQADLTEIQTEADIECLSVTKRLLVDAKGRPAPQLAAIYSGDNALKIWLRKRAFPSMFKAGVYRAPYAFVDSIDQEFSTYKAKRQGELVPALVEAYPSLIEEAARRLRKQFRMGDYLTQSELAATFKMQWRFRIFDVPLALAEIRKDLLQREREKAADDVRDEVEIIQQTLRGEMKELVDHMVERLSGTDDKGRPKIFRESLLGNIREFLDLFERRNLTDDSRLKELVDQARGMIKGVNTDSLRDSSSVRQQIRTSFTAIQQTLDGMVTSKPSRSITFED